MYNSGFADAIYGKKIYPVVPFDREQKLVSLDLSAGNKMLSPGVFSDTAVFSNYIDSVLAENNALYAIGGYNELRSMYSRSVVFSGTGSGEPRRLHLGTDIWGKAGTVVSSPLDAEVHSFANNGDYGDYGGTIILRHDLDGFQFYTLYGHLSLASIENIFEGKMIGGGYPFATFGEPHENGQWPPHLHFQVILDIGDHHGDYPGVCAASQKEKWLSNSPDPDLLLRMNRFAG